MKLKLILLGLITVLIVTTLSGCGHDKVKAIKVGAIAGPESELVEVAVKVAKQRYGLDVKVINFSDYSLPNEALNDGSIDANIFQHIPYLNAQVKQRGYQFAVIGKGFVYPIGVYSNKYKNIADIPVGGKIAVPNDPSNEARSLLLLEKAGLIKLQDINKSDATVRDIVSNPKKLIITELESPQLPRALADVDCAVINNTFAIAAGLKLDNAIYKEGSDSLYVNDIVVRKADLDRADLKQLVQAFQSQEVADKAKELFGDGAIAAFTPSQNK